MTSEFAFEAGPGEKPLGFSPMLRGAALKPDVTHLKQNIPELLEAETH